MLSFFKSSTERPAEADQQEASKSRECVPEDVQHIVEVLQRNRQSFMTDDNSFSPDHFNSVKVLLLDRYPNHCVQEATELFLATPRETEALSYVDAFVLRSKLKTE